MEVDSNIEIKAKGQGENSALFGLMFLYKKIKMVLVERIEKEFKEA